MDLNSIKTVWLRLRWQTERLGPAGKLGFGLLVFSAVFFLVAVLPRQEESKALMAEAKALETRVRREPSAESGSPRRRLQGDQALPAFYEFFPKLDSSPFWIGELVRIAGERGVEISGTEYRMVREKDLKLARYEMMVPVRLPDAPHPLECSRVPQVPPECVAGVGRVGDEAAPAHDIGGLADQAWLRVDRV